MNKYLIALFLLISSFSYSQTNGIGTFYVRDNFILTNTQFNDISTSAIQTRVNPATSLPAFSYDSMALLFVHDADSSEKAFYSIQIMHGYKQQTKFYPHIHWMQYALADTTWQLRLRYRVHNINGTSGVWKYLTIFNHQEFTFGTAPFHQVAEFPTATMTGSKESTIIDFQLYRYNATGVATVYMKTFDCHFEMEKLGTDNEYPQ